MKKSLIWCFKSLVLIRLDGDSNLQKYIFKRNWCGVSISLYTNDPNNILHLQANESYNIPVEIPSQQSHDFKSWTRQV